MKHKKGLAILLMMALVFSFLTGCNNDTSPTTVSGAEASVKDILKKSFDAMETQTSVQLSCVNDYRINMTIEEEGVYISNEIVNSYTNTYKYVKGVGFAANAESDYSILSSLPGVSEETLSQNLKLSYYSFYDETADVFYHTDVNDVTRWIKIENMDVNGLVPSLKDAVLLCEGSLTMQKTETEIRISQPLSALYQSEGFQTFLLTYRDVLDNVSEFTSLLPVASIGTATYVIDSETFLLKEFLITGIEISNTALSDVLDTDNEDALNGSSLSGNIRVIFSDYNAVNADEIISRGKDVMAKAISMVENIPDETQPDLSDLEPDIVYESPTAFDRYDVTSYDFKTLSLADMNKIKIKNNDYVFPFSMSILGENGWILNDADGDGWISYTHPDYDAFSILDAYDVFQIGSYDSLATDGVYGINWNVYDAVVNNALYPEASFTSYDITFGMSATEVLTLLGKPDTIYIGENADIYQFSLYDMEDANNIITFSLILHMYHTDTVEGLYTVDIQYLEEGDVPNGN